MSDDNGRVGVNLGGTPQDLHHGVGRSAINELMHSKASLWMDLMRAVDNDTQRKIITTVYQRDSRAMYDDVMELTTVRKDTLTTHATRLEDKGIIERHSRPTILSFPSRDVEALAAEALSLYYNSLD